MRSPKPRPSPSTARVRFYGIVRVKPTVNHREYTDEEWSSTWYARHEYRSFRRLEIRRRNASLLEGRPTTTPPPPLSPVEGMAEGGSGAFMCHESNSNSSRWDIAGDRWNASGKAMRGNSGGIETHNPSHSPAAAYRKHARKASSFPAIPVRYLSMPLAQRDDWFADTGRIGIGHRSLYSCDS